MKKLGHGFKMQIQNPLNATLIYKIILEIIVMPLFVREVQPIRRFEVNFRPGPCKTSDFIRSGFEVYLTQLQLARTFHINITSCRVTHYRDWMDHCCMEMMLPGSRIFDCLWKIFPKKQSSCSCELLRPACIRGSLHEVNLIIIILSLNKYSLVIFAILVKKVFFNSVCNMVQNIATEKYFWRLCITPTVRHVTGGYEKRVVTQCKPLWHTTL